MAESGAPVDAPSWKGKPLEGKRERVLSTIDFPYGSLDDAIAVVKAVYRLGGNECRLDSLAAELGHDTVKSGGFRQKLSTAHTFGLTALSQGIVTLSTLGSKIIDPEQEKAARVEAFLKVPLYNSLYEEFKNSQLPPNQGLESKMISLGVAAKQSDKARQAFQRSAKEAGFFAYGTTKLVYPALGAANVQKPKEPEVHQPDSKDKTGAGEGGGGKKRHPFIEGLLETLPPAALGAGKTEWGLKERQDWLQTAAGIFNLIYTAKADDKGAVTVSVIAPKEISAN